MNIRIIPLTCPPLWSDHSDTPALNAVGYWDYLEYLKMVLTKEQWHTHVADTVQRFPLLKQITPDYDLIEDDAVPFFSARVLLTTHDTSHEDDAPVDPMKADGVPTVSAAYNVPHDYRHYLGDTTRTTVFITVTPYLTERKHRASSPPVKTRLTRELVQRGDYPGVNLDRLAQHFRGLLVFTRRTSSVDHTPKTKTRLNPETATSYPFFGGVLGDPTASLDHLLPNQRYILDQMNEAMLNNPEQIGFVSKEHWTRPYGRRAFDVATLLEVLEARITPSKHDYDDDDERPVKRSKSSSVKVLGIGPAAAALSGKAPAARRLPIDFPSSLPNDDDDEVDDEDEG